MIVKVAWPLRPGQITRARKVGNNKSGILILEFNAFSGNLMTLSRTLKNKNTLFLRDKTVIGSFEG